MFQQDVAKFDSMLQCFNAVVGVFTIYVGGTEVIEVFIFTLNCKQNCLCFLGQKPSIFYEKVYKDYYR